MTARLEQAAPANEIYIGEVTYRLVRDAVEAEPVEPLALKGKSQPVAAYRLISARGQQGNVRRHDTPVVGRDEEFPCCARMGNGRLRPSRQLVTVIGDAGVGKSRLVRELMDRVGGGARIIFGRCLAYGEGITFWPLREMVVEAAEILRGRHAGDRARETLACAGDHDVADRLASAAGLSATTVSAARNLLGRATLHATLAARRSSGRDDRRHPLGRAGVPGSARKLLETVDDAPVLHARYRASRFARRTPDWGEREHSKRLVLHPLADAASAQVVTNLLGAAGLPEALVHASLMRRKATRCTSNRCWRC